MLTEITLVSVLRKAGRGTRELVRGPTIAVLLMRDRVGLNQNGKN